MPFRAPIAKPAGSENAARDRERHRRAGGLRRLYDSAQWRRRTQPYILARDPLCTIAVLCGGRAPSTDVDHEVPAEIYVAAHGGDERYFFDENNLRGACHADHTRKTSLEKRGLWKEPSHQG
jgi:5-methylcytosine-specific restriction enzyme A